MFYTLQCTFSKELKEIAIFKTGVHKFPEAPVNNNQTLFREPASFNPRLPQINARARVCDELILTGKLQY